MADSDARSSRAWQTPISPAELACACWAYESMTPYTRSLDAFHSDLDRPLDLTHAAHASLMLTWLNAWGTKIPKAQFHDIRNRLREWHEHNANLFPPPDLSLLEAEDADLDLGGDLFDSLKTIMRGNDAGEARLKIVETASAKILFALRPRLFPAWDDRMRKKPLRGGPKYDGTGASYSRFAKDVRRELRQTAKLCSQLSFDIDDFPARLGRPAYTTPAQLMIELYLVAITRGANPPPFALIRL